MSEDHLPTPIEPTPLVLIQQSLQAGIKPSDIKELFDLQVRYEQRRAEEAYADAITAFQAWCPPIHKGKDVLKKDGGKAYGYATFDQIMKVITPGLRAHRIVISFDTAEADGRVQVTCRTRVGVVEKHTTVLLPVPPASAMTNPTQASVGAISYGKRTSLCAALNIVCTDEDVDGVQEQPQPAAQVHPDVAALRRVLADGPTASELTELYLKDVMALPKGSHERQQAWNYIADYARKQGWPFDAKQRCFVEPQEAGA